MVLLGPPVTTHGPSTEVNTKGEGERGDNGLLEDYRQEKGHAAESPC